MNFNQILLDDYIPYDKEYNCISFAKTSKNFYWVSLVEKAFAKILGGYLNIVNDKDEEEENSNKNKIYSKSELAFQMLAEFILENYLFSKYEKILYKKKYNERLHKTNTTKNEILIALCSIKK